MGKKLTDRQIADFERDGFVFPVDVLTMDEVASVVERMKAAEAKDPGSFTAENRNNSHLAHDFFDELVHHPNVVDAVEDLIGPDILAMSSVVFSKDPHSDYC